MASFHIIQCDLPMVGKVDSIVLQDRSLITLQIDQSAGAGLNDQLIREFRETVKSVGIVDVILFVISEEVDVRSFDERVMNQLGWYRQDGCHECKSRP